MSTETTDKFQYSFTGKRVLITGGAGGVGQALVSRLYKDGSSVYVLDKDPVLVSQLSQEFPDKSKLRAEVCDISKWKETQDLIESFGPMDHLINCAVVNTPTDLLDIEESLVDLNFAVNLKSYLCTSQAVAKGMIAGGIKGTVVNIASIAAHTFFPKTLLYCVTKAGVIMLTKCLAVELGKHGIRVNSISPTAIDTPLFQEELQRNPNFIEENSLLKRQPLSGKKVLDKDEVVNSILFLLSPLSSLATGMDLVLDAGILAT